MSFYIYWARPAVLKKRNFQRVAHVPFIFDESWKYHRESSTYLIERATCTWPESIGHFPKRYPTKKSLEGFAEALTNFLEWSQSRKVDWKFASYSEHVYELYQKEMLKGTWSARGNPLAPATINRRVDEVCNFLSWASARGLRESFTPITHVLKRRDPIATTSHGHQPRDIQVRTGRVRKNPSELYLPTDAEIGKWLRYVESRHGRTKGLMCRLVLDTGIRREEAACWRIDTLPELVENWHILGDQVKVGIKYGCKGQDYGEDHGDKIGPERHIWMSLEMASQLHEYRRSLRLKSRAKWIKAAPTISEQRSRIALTSPHLFLSEYDGTRITASTLYDAWTKIDCQPFKGWSPHAGRHWWACKLLLREYQKRKAQLGSNAGVVPLDWISGNASSDIQLLIAPQLGHVDKSTSERYVQWVVKMLENEGLQVAYQDWLDDIEANYANLHCEPSHG